MNRDHYESVLWTMGTVFVATSLALFGISFLKDVVGTGKFERVALMALFSLFLFAVWLAYVQHVGPWIRTSLNRCREIEELLSQFKFGLRETPKFQTSIWKESQKQRRGIWITSSLLSALLLAWFLQIALFNICTQQISTLIGLLFILLLVCAAGALASRPKW